MGGEKGKLILFGAGKNGRKALEKYGEKAVAYFCDNDSLKVGNKISGIEIISYDTMKRLHKQGFSIMITPSYHAYQVGQLEKDGIYDYIIYKNAEGSYSIKDFFDLDEKQIESNRLLKNLIEASCKMDPLENVRTLRNSYEEAMRLYNERGITYYGLPLESQYYGNMQVLIDYAEIDQDDVPYFPIVSHYNDRPIFHVDFMYLSAVIFSGTYFREKIHIRAPWVPVFSVGPYIHYAKNMYSTEKIAHIKGKNGRTMLVFLPHSIPNFEREYLYKNFIDKLLEEYGRKFDTFIACTYWADINSKAAYYAEEKGLKVVSAGIISDKNYDRRLRALFDMADAVSFCDVGTFIQYALYLDKPLYKIGTEFNEDLFAMQLTDQERVIGITSEYVEFQKKFDQLFDAETHDKESQKKLLNPYAGFEQIKSKEEIRNILKISKDIWIQCDGNMRHYPEAVKRVYDRYEGQGDFHSMSMLREAVGGYLDS